MTSALHASGSPSSVSIQESRIWKVTDCISVVTDNQPKIQSAFQAAFRKMTVLGHSESSLIECSEVIVPPPALKATALLPAGASLNDIEQAVRFILPFSGA